MKAWEYGKLRVSDNRNILQRRSSVLLAGRYGMADVCKADRRGSSCLLRNRKEKGYNVIQSTLIHDCAEKQRWRKCTVQGRLCHTRSGGRILGSSGTYGQHGRRTWDLYGSSSNLGRQCRIRKAAYGKCRRISGFSSLGHFGSQTNIIWLAGGDVKGEAAPEVFCHIGKRLKEESDGHLVGFHPFGRTSSSQWFQEEDWLDFNMFQSGHRRYDQVVLGAWDDNGKNPNQYGEDNWRYVQADLAKTPLKPTIDGEPSYEQIVHGLHDNTQPYWQSWDTRRYAYWSVFAGAFGHTFGDNAIMQFFRKDLEKERAFGVWQDWERGSSQHRRDADGAFETSDGERRLSEWMRSAEPGDRRRRRGL